jgi:hypothetical protein
LTEAGFLDDKFYSGKVLGAFKFNFEFSGRDNFVPTSLERFLF